MCVCMCVCVCVCVCVIGKWINLTLTTGLVVIFQKIILEKFFE